MEKRTKIVATLGPSSNTRETIQAMIEAGVNVIRLNFSHGTHEEHKALIDHVKAIREELDLPVAIMQDVQGPKIRIGVLPEQGITLKMGDVVVFDTAITEYTESHIPIDYKELHNCVSAGERILLHDGRVETKITQIEGTKITAEVLVGGELSSHKGINIPDATVYIEALTEKDKADAKFGVEHGVDLVAMSFVTRPQEILDLRYALKEYQKELNKQFDPEIKIIAKIERKEAVENIDQIIDVADGLMVARGDLGVEIPAQDVPLVQKKLIDLGLQAAKPVIVATQMLDSMTEHPKPTRAEVSDVANAVIDHTDAVMLSNETASGAYPVESVATMATIIAETEASHYDALDIEEDECEDEKQPVSDIISELSRMLADRVDADIILAASLSGETGRLVSRYRPELPIVVVTNREVVRRQLNLSWGVVPFVLPDCHSLEELVERAMTILKEKKLVEKGNTVVLVAGEPVGTGGQVNVLEVRIVS